MFTVLLDYIRGVDLESTSIIVLASDDDDAKERALEVFEQETGGASYVSARIA